jgi:PEGA domain
MYRVILVLGGGLLLAGCSSTPDWMNFDAFKPAPPTDSVAFESSPAGATATLSTGQNCKTPCSLTIPSDKPFSVTFSLTGYQPESMQVESVMADGAVRLQPNPVVAELTAAPPAKPAPKKPAKKKVSAAAKPKPATTAAAPASTTAAPATAAAPSAAATSPWPGPPTQKQ